jgi:alpha-tubulin suppressor-like RCC1 family protein
VVWAVGLAGALGVMGVASAPAIANSAGQLYAFGANYTGQLGSATNTNPNPAPALVGLPSATGPVVQVAAGDSHSLAVTSTGQLYTFGFNNFGQLGIATNSGTEDPNPTPTLVGLPGATGPVVQAAAGTEDSVAVTSTGQLYAFGDNFYGELGFATNTNANPTPMLVRLPGETGPVVQVAAGGAHSLVVTSSGQLYAFGDDSWGQLGSPSPNPMNFSNPTPTLVRLPGETGPVVQVAAGFDHSLAVTSTGQLYAFGRNDFGELGMATSSDQNSTPTLVRLPGATGPVVQVAAGLAHSLAVTSSGQLYAFGNNYSGQLGIATNSGTNNPTPPTLVRLPGETGGVVLVAAGWGHSLAVTSSGQLYAFGLNDYGELGSPTNNGAFNPNPNPTPMLVSLPGGVSVETVASGPTAEHSLVVTGSPEVVAVPSNPFTVRQVRVRRRGIVEFDVSVPESGELDVLETNSTPSPPRRAHTVLLRPGPDRYAFARRHLGVADAGTLRVTVLPSARGARQVRHHYRPVRINLWVTYQAADGTPATVAFINLLVTR